MTKIAHIADLHVRNLSRHDEYRQVIDEFVNKCIELNVDRILVAGDSFHTKTSGMSPECIDLMTTMFTKFASVALVDIILGNHDFNLVNKLRQDAISPLITTLNNKNITLYKNSGVYNFAPNFNWCLFSLTDKENWDIVKPISNDVNIALYHGPVYGALTESDWEIEDALNVSFFKDFQFVMLGDIHRLQYLAHRNKKPWIAYPGSFIQQNYAEDVDNHGFLLWDIKSKDDYSVEFHNLKNPKPYVTIQWQKDPFETLSIAKQYIKGSRFRILNKETLSQKDIVDVTNLLKEEISASEVTFITEHQQKRDAIIKTNALNISKNDLRNVDVLMKLLKDFNSDSEIISQDLWVNIYDLAKKYLSQVGDEEITRNVVWTLRDLKFDYTFAYGKENRINFDNLTGVVGVFGPNRSGKSSIVGTIMYGLFNDTDRGAIKNIHIVNTRYPYCYVRSTINVDGTDYVIERQTVKSENKKRKQTNAITSLNFYKLVDGELLDLVGEQRSDTDKQIRKLIGSSEDFLLTSLSAQDEIKLFISQGSTKRRQILSRFLDLDVFDKMFEFSKNDMNAIKAVLKSLPDRDWNLLESECRTKIAKTIKQLNDCENTLQKDRETLDHLKHELSIHNNYELVPESTIIDIRKKILIENDKLSKSQKYQKDLKDNIAKLEQKLEKISILLKTYNIKELKEKQDHCRELSNKVSKCEHVFEREQTLLKQQEKTLKILDEVPCGNSFPMCKFIKDAFDISMIVDAQRLKVRNTNDSFELLKHDFELLDQNDIQEKIKKLEQINEIKNKSNTEISKSQIELVKLESEIKISINLINELSTKLQNLELAYNNAENVEISTIKSKIDILTQQIKNNDQTKISVAIEHGKLQVVLDKLIQEKQKRIEVLQQMRAYEIITRSFSKKGIPNVVTKTQLPLINEEISKILNNIVDFTIELEIDDVNDSMEMYINYGDSRRIIELGSGMEKMMASVALRVALINISSLPKTDMFIIDEGFGALDESGVEACNRLLTSLKRYFKCILIVTHVEGIKDSADTLLEIVKTEKDTKILYV